MVDIFLHFNILELYKQITKYLVLNIMPEHMIYVAP